MAANAIGTVSAVGPQMKQCKYKKQTVDISLAPRDTPTHDVLSGCTHFREKQSLGHTEQQRAHCRQHTPTRLKHSGVVQWGPTIVAPENAYIQKVRRGWVYR